jgi:hypothetical protein
LWSRRIWTHLFHFGSTSAWQLCPSISVQVYFINNSLIKNIGTENHSICFHVPYYEAKKLVLHYSHDFLVHLTLRMLSAVGCLS